MYNIADAHSHSHRQGPLRNRRYPQKRDALLAAGPLRVRISVESAAGRPVTVKVVIDQFMQQELVTKRYTTRKSYLSCLKRVIQHWGITDLQMWRAIAFEQWLCSLSLAPKTESHIRTLMYLLYHMRRDGK